LLLEVFRQLPRDTRIFALLAACPKLAVTGRAGTVNVPGPLQIKRCRWQNRTARQQRGKKSSPQAEVHHWILVAGEGKL